MAVIKKRSKIVFLLTTWALLNLGWHLFNYNSYSSLSYHYDSSTQIQQHDWHDNIAIAAALNRTGLGEQGVAVSFLDHHKKLYQQYGFDALLSDQISVNRSVPDIRPIMCKNITYDVQLPKAAIIIIFYNERLSVLLRTVHSILNRTPQELLHEMILVDDGSTWSDMQAPLVEYLSINFPPERNKVRLLRLHERKGLMVARMSGARVASKESRVLIFLDSHFEVMYNWLPPLLAPIALNPKACTVPALDVIKFDTFQYEFWSGHRGYFNWALVYYMLYSNMDSMHPELNYREYAMMGGAMAIGADFFWQLGGFDEGMKLWGGEQYEMSFKVWMCGGELLNVPCSRMGHLFRDPETQGNTNLYNDYSFINRNLRRLIDVWMDEEHRKYVMKHRPSIVNADPGDLTERLAIRDRLQCKNFTWMLDNIMPDLKFNFPPVKRGDFANGFIRNVQNPTLCIAIDEKKSVVLQQCNNYSKAQQFWRYTSRAELRLSDEICLERDVQNKHVNTYKCHLSGGNQRWYYDRQHQLISQPKFNHCMIADFENDRVVLASCNAQNLSMQWSIDYINQTEMDSLENVLRNLI